MPTKNCEMCWKLIQVKNWIQKYCIQCRKKKDKQLRSEQVIRNREKREQEKSFKS